LRRNTSRDTFSETMQPRLYSSNLVGISETVNPLAVANRTCSVLPMRCSCRISLYWLAFKNGRHLALANHVFVTSPRDAIGAKACQPNYEVKRIAKRYEPNFLP
jgi:hypothetical protein